MPQSNLSEARRKFIERWVLVPEITYSEIAEAIGCTQDWVIKVANKKHLLDQREENRQAATAKMRSSLPKILLSK